MKQIKNKTALIMYMALAVFALSGCGQRLNVQQPPDRVQDAYGY